MVFEIKEGWLQQDGQRVVNTENTTQIGNVIEERILLQLKQHKFTKMTLPPSETNRSYFIWKKEPVPTSDYTRNLVLVSTTTLPGVWNDRAYLDYSENQSTQFPFIQHAKENEVLDYNTISTFSVGTHDSPKQTAYERFKSILVYLLENEFVKGSGSEVDIMTSGFGGECVYKFISKCPQFAKKRLGFLVMFNSPASIEMIVNNMTSIEELSMKQYIQERAFNIFVKKENANIGFDFEQSTKAGCTCIISSARVETEIPCLVMQFAFGVIQDKIVEHKIYRIRTTLMSVLLVVSFVFLLLLKDYSPYIFHK